MNTRIEQYLGSYRLLRLLGQGGFAEVYLAEHLQLQTQAAIKVLQGPMTSQALQEFRKEAQVIATLRHPHIVILLDFAVQNGLPFLVMDYAPKGSLAQRHAQSAPLSLPTVLSYVQQVGEALQFAHDHRVIHRDLKPENILVGRHDELLLSDFGIATMVSTSSSVKTQTIVGTTPYMAPEQILGKPVAASDQYALGILAYTWLCGRLPFTGSVTEVIAQHLAAPPPSLRSLNPAIPAHVEDVVMTALAKEATARFATVKNFVTAFERALEDARPAPTLKARLSTFLSSKKREQSGPSQPLAPTLPAPAPEPDPAAIDRAYGEFYHQIQQQVWSDSTSAPRGSLDSLTGAFIVRAAPDQIGQVVHIQDPLYPTAHLKHAYVKVYTVSGYSLPAAYFKQVLEAEYHIWIDGGRRFYAVVTPGEVTLVDIRPVRKTRTPKK